MLSFNKLKEVLVESNQQQLLDFWEDLTPEEQEDFLKQLASIDFKNVNDIFQKAQQNLAEDTKKLDCQMEPIPADQFESETGVTLEVLNEYREIGLEEIAKSHVAVLLLAGGQGTRLGVTYPKGMFPIDLPSGKTLYQVQAERIRRLIQLAKEHTGNRGKIFWYIMTSQATHDATKKYLEDHHFFGLNKDDVILFKQGLLPCYAFDGKIILERKNLVALAPDGNGGLYLALKRNKVIEDMKNRGVKYVHAHSVDNILVKVADPVFVGYCVKHGADCGNKVVKKKNPTEAVGVVCKVDGRFQVVEYSEITEATANLRDYEGNLVFRAGNICNHFFTTDFLHKVSEKHEQELKLHVARKKIPFVNEVGEKTQPTSPNGIKIEKFIFDVFQFSENFVTWEVPRHCDFSPLKNCESVSKDCPSTVRRDLLDLHRSYIETAGGKVLCDEVEISPLVSYAGENLTDKVQGKEFDKRTVLVSDEETVANGY